MRVPTRTQRSHTLTTEPPADVLGPAALLLHADRLRVGERWQRTFAIGGYPREVGYGWLTPLLRGAPQLELSLHVEPFPAELAAQRLHKQRARFESTRRIDAERGSLADLGIAAAAEDAHQLANRLARGESRLFRAGLYLSVSADSEHELDDACARVRALCASQLLTLIPASFRPLDGWLSTLPLALDRLRLRRTFDSAALAASFPFAAAEPPLEHAGCFYGLAASGAPVVFDRFDRDNYNSVILARSGAGKSYLAKLEALRLLYQGVQVFIVDPEDEYRRLCQQVGGAYLPLGGPDAVALNPLDLPAGHDDALAERSVFLSELVELLTGGLSGSELAALDRAIRDCYVAAGIDNNPDTHTRPAPLLRDLAAQLEQHGADGTRVGERLSPYTQGSLSQLFNRPTSVHPQGQLVCFSLRGLSERLKPVALLLCLDAIWRSLDGPPCKRCVLVDEAWLLMREPAGASFLYRLAKSARKRWCGLTTITQDAGDLLATELGQAIVNNAASHILLRQAPQAIQRVADAFRLTDGEQRYLLSCPQGHGLFVVGDDRFALRVLASPAEHPLVTSDPEFLASLEREGENSGVEAA
jgi:type IV secretory pathway VirB4 component